MAITDIAQGTSGVVSSVVQTLVFWKDWGTTSQYLLIACVLLVVFSYIIVNKAIKKSMKVQFQHNR